MHLQLQDLLLSKTILSILPPSLKESLFLQPHFWIKDSHQVSTVLQISHLLLGHFAKLLMTLLPQDTLLYSLLRQSTSYMEFLLQKAIFHSLLLAF